MANFLSFTLREDFLAPYREMKSPFGYRDAGGNSVGEITFLRTYSRLKEDGTKETWVDVCERVINGMYSLQKDHAKANRLPWSDSKAAASAKEAFDRLFHLKWTPPGRGLWVMGTPLVNEQKNSAALQNCAFVSTLEMTKLDPARPYRFLMEASMLGVGVGFDDKGADKEFTIYKPLDEVSLFVVPDTREGWVESLSLIINSYLKPDQPTYQFDYSEIRPAGTPIKTFGGTAAGHASLEKLHNHVRKTFDGREGQLLTRVDIADLGNLIGVCVVSGNVRRSAELLIGRLNDDDFLNLKNPERFPERNSYNQKNPGWAWMSNNSVEVSVGDDLDHIVSGIALNGEPGVVWMDTTRKYGRLADPINNKDHRAAGYNPCVTADTWVMTAEGPRQVRDLIGRKFNALVHGKPFESLSNGFWLTGKDREVFDLTTEEGWTLRLTANHQVLTKERGWVEAGQLIEGDQVVLHDHHGHSWDGRGTEEEGYLLGHLWGDGTFSGNRAVLSIWGDNTEELRNHVYGAAYQLNHRSDWQGFVEIPDRKEWRLRSSALSDLAANYGMAAGSKKINDDIEQASSAFQVGFLRGAFDTDGSIEGTLAKGVSIRLHQSDREQLQRVQRMLARLGIVSTIYTTRGDRKSVLPDGRGGHALYDSRASWRLVIANQFASNFMERIGFADPAKAEKWYNIETQRVKKRYTKDAVATFLALVPAGRADVYDVTIQDVHAFDANGLYVHNCAEQPLESFEMCTLVETYLNRHENMEDFKRTLKFAYLYAKTVTLVPTHWEETNAIMQRNRRIGTSISGIANFSDIHGLPALRTWMNDGYRVIQEHDKVYSEWLGVRESIKTTTVKPSGTVSILAGESPGVHWTPGGKYFLRAIRFGNNDPMLPLFKMANYRVEAAAESPETTSVVFFPIRSDARRAERDVTIFEKIALAATAQHYWSDNSVSVTVTFDPESESQHVGTVLKMYDGQLKTVSFLPSGNYTYAQMPYTQISEEEYEAERLKLFPIDFAGVYAGMAIDAVGEAYCTTDSCEVKLVVENRKSKKGSKTQPRK